ncbi:hypothetical protein V6N13_077501 [Hibiscus sabdariffa]
MVTAARDWDWSRLSLVLSDHILSHIAAFPPPNMRFGRDLPGWRWEQDRRFSTKYAYASLVVEASNDSETVDHVLYKCSVAKRVWQGVIAPDKLQGFYAMPFLVWFDRNIRDGGTFTYARENWASSFRLIMQRPFLPLILGWVLNEPLAIPGELAVLVEQQIIVWDLN